MLRLSIHLEVAGGENPEQFWRRGENIIIVLWHGRQLMVPFAYKGKKPYALISMHSDGEIISRVMPYFGFASIRGSTSRGGMKALKAMIQTGREGNDLVITPDGPRGPKQALQAGVVTLAKKTGMPVLPLSFGSTKKKILASWDGFQIAYPFSKGVFIWGEPVYVEDSSDKKYLKSVRVKIENELDKVTLMSDRYYSEQR